MFLQGNLQAVFDALYTVGAIDPILKADWSKVTEEMEKQPQIVQRSVALINGCRGDHQKLVMELRRMDSQCVSFVALEVAREFSEFQERQSLQ